MKVFTAIEIVFIIFILIVVVLVVIQMFTRFVSPQRILPYVENIEELAKLDYMRQFCDNICSSVKTATNYGSKLQSMVQWCLSKITDKGKDYIDIIEDGINGFYVVAGYPYCEAGTYCFHFFTCDVGIILNERECRRVLCEYYYKTEGDMSKAERAIKNMIDWGRCSVDRTRVEGKRLLTDSSKWWYDKYFGNINCEDLLFGEEVEEVGEEVEEEIEEETGE